MLFGEDDRLIHEEVHGDFVFRSLSPSIGQHGYVGEQDVFQILACRRRVNMDRKARRSGRPNYESIKDGDEPEPYWVLFLSEAICVDEDPASEINRTETNVTKLQLSVDSYERYRRFLEKNATARGSLTHGITGHHHTEVLMNVIEIKAPNHGLQRDAPQVPHP